MIEFSSEYYLINDNGIDLLRSRFSYRHINYSAIDSAKIYNGYLLKNRFLPLIAGILMILFSYQLLLPAIQIFMECLNSSGHLNSKGVGTILFLPLSLIGIGSYFVVQSFKKSKF